MGITEYGGLLFINKGDINQHATMKLAITQRYVYLGFSLDVESLSTADAVYEYKDIGSLRVAGV